MVSTHLKNISQIGSFPQVKVKITNIWNHHPDNIQFPCHEKLGTLFHKSSVAQWRTKLCLHNRWQRKFAPLSFHCTAGGALQWWLSRWWLNHSSEKYSQIGNLPQIGLEHKEYDRLKTTTFLFLGKENTHLFYCSPFFCWKKTKLLLPTSQSIFHCRQLSWA